MSTSAELAPEVYLAAFERLPVPVLVVERSTTVVVEANAAARHLLAPGRRPDDDAGSDEGASVELIGSRLADLVTRPLDALVDDLRIAASGGDLPLVLRRPPAGHSGQQDCQVRPIGAGPVEAWLLSLRPNAARLGRFQDLSAKVREANAQAGRERVIHRQLLDEYRVLERFASAMAHDLKGPLRHIGALLPVIEESLGAELRPDVRRLLEAVSGSAERGRRLVDALLEHAKAVSGELNREPIDLDRLVEELVAARRVDLEGIEHQVTIERPLGVVDGDPALTQLLVDNLLANAIKYRDAERTLRIQIGAGQPDDDTIIEVRDNGIGFDDDQVDAVLEPFKRLATHVEGHGIGLATCQAICQRQGWTLHATGRRGRGARFRIQQV